MSEVVLFLRIRVHIRAKKVGKCVGEFSDQFSATQQNDFIFFFQRKPLRAILSIIYHIIKVKGRKVKALQSYSLHALLLQKGFKCKENPYTEVNYVTKGINKSNNQIKTSCWVQMNESRVIDKVWSFRYNHFYVLI